MGIANYQLLIQDPFKVFERFKVPGPKDNDWRDVNCALKRNGVSLVLY